MSSSFIPLHVMLLFPKSNTHNLAISWDSSSVTTCVTHSTWKCRTRHTDGVHNLYPSTTTPTRKTTTKHFLFNLAPLHILKLKPNICAVCACVWQDLGPHTNGNARQTKKQEADLERRELNTTPTQWSPITLQPFVRLHLFYPFLPSESLTLHH